jgi:L-ribulose-5-phosphate 3-epimerase
MKTHQTRRDILKLSAWAWPALSIFGKPNEKASPAGPFRLGIICDEISQDFGEAVNFISSDSLHYVELRELWHKNIMNITKDDAARAKSLIESHGLKVSDIGSPIFKYNLPQMPTRKERRDTFRADFTDEDSDSLLLKSFDLAHFFGTRKVRVFSFWRVEQPEKAYPYVRDRMAKAAEFAAKHQILLVLENEHECNIGTGRELGRILRDINSPHLRGNWDPGNDAMLHEVPYPYGYEQVRGLFAHMHVKDVKKNPATGKLQWAPVGGGFIDWRGQLKALIRDHYEGTMSLETHYRRPDGNAMQSTRESLQGLLKLIHEVA